MDVKKIAFIICVNDEEEFEECRYYLEQLFVPDGYYKHKRRLLHDCRL